MGVLEPCRTGGSWLTFHGFLLTCFLTNVYKGYHNLMGLKGIFPFIHSFIHSLISEGSVLLETLRIMHGFGTLDDSSGKDTKMHSNSSSA